MIMREQLPEGLCTEYSEQLKLYVNSSQEGYMTITLQRSKKRRALERAPRMLPSSGAGGLEIARSRLCPSAAGMGSVLSERCKLRHGQMGPW